MKSSNKVVTEFRGIPKQGLVVLEKLEIGQRTAMPEGHFDATMTVRLRSPQPDDPRRLEVTFFGVRNLRIAPAEGTVLSIGHLDIRDVDERGWEDIAYEVVDLEEDAIRFLCKSFSAQMITL